MTSKTSHLRLNDSYSVYMLFLLLRIILAPASVLLGSVAQRRFGHAIGGLIVGLPLLFLPFLWLIGHQYGVAFARAMTASLLVAATAEVALMWVFAFLAQRFSATKSTVGALVAFALVATMLRYAHVSVLVGAVLAILSFALALVLWPRAATVAHTPSKQRLGLRLAVSTVFTVVLISLAGRMGAGIAGVFDAIPLTSLMMAFFTGREVSAQASSAFLRGVTRGSFSYIASMFVLARTWREGNELRAFAFALLVALVVQLAVQSSGVVLRLGRMIVAINADEILGEDVLERIPGSTTFRKFYESIAVQSDVTVARLPPPAVVRRSTYSEHPRHGLSLCETS